jgi:GNAT superfamily N-acetyltransferase
VPNPLPIARFFAANDALLERMEPTWWGAVATDRRFPNVYDVNYARVDRATPDLRLKDVEGPLLPALRESGAGHFHVVVFEPHGCRQLLEDLQRAGHVLYWDSVMEFRGQAPDLTRPGHAVAELDPSLAELWTLQDLLFREFGVSDPEARRQLVSWARDVLAPAGRKWFGVELDGGMAGMGSVQVQAGVGYVDDVLTLPLYRRRGVATSIIRRLVAEARGAGAERVLLLSDDPDPTRLYRALRFEEVGRVASVTTRLSAQDQDSGSSGSPRSGAASPLVVDGDPAHGAGPG